MKTMLKTPFAKAFYLCNSFLLITTSYSGNISAFSNVHKNEEKKVGASITPLELKRSTSGKMISPSAVKAEVTFDKPQMKLNRKGMSYVKKYIRKKNACLVGVKKRSQVPFYIIDSVFTCYGLPVELKYLAVIESELKPTALSHVGARGPWQLMPGTAHILGLKVNRQCDERSNYYKSTIAAAKYLRDLYALFDDWLLVLAAYNGGPRPVYSAIHKSGSRNFWVLQKYLPAESREHVKKFIATHYYFEGRGSETTLTRAENVKFKKTVIAFAKTLRAPQSCQTIQSIPVGQITETTYNTPFLNYDFNLIFQYGGTGYEQNIRKNNILTRETPKQKFNRLMKESEESLKNSRRII
jgi:membrane-bound lytic murein transglycosylase D